MLLPHRPFPFLLTMNQTILCLKETKNGWTIARVLDDGALEQLSFPFESIKKAQEFCAIANYDNRFIPSALPHIRERFNKEG